MNLLTIDVNEEFLYSRIVDTAARNKKRYRGNHALRKPIAKHAFNWNGQISDHDIVTTQGCMEALVFCIKAINEPDDTMAKERKFDFAPLPRVTDILEEQETNQPNEIIDAPPTKVTFDCDYILMENMKNYGYWEGLKQKDIILESLKLYFHEKKSVRALIKSVIVPR